MSFVYPQFLWALGFLAVPIVVHLFNFRRYKTVYFSRVKFLKEVTEDSRSGIKLKHLLVLLCRILAITALVFAFAQPFVPAMEGEMTENISSVYIDNSFSMESAGEDGNLLNEVKNKAIDLVESFPEDEKVNLMTCDLLSSEHRFNTRNEAIEKIKEIDLSPKSTQLSTVLKSQSELLRKEEIRANKRIFVFSDFQKTTTDLESLPPGDIPVFYYQPTATLPGNIYVDSVWFETPVHRLNSPVDVYFRVRNETANDANDLSVNLAINGSDPAPKRINVSANSFAEDKITFIDRNPGSKLCEISVITNQLFFDDSYYFTYDIKEQVEILIVKNQTDKSTNLEQLYILDPYYHFSAVAADQLTQEQLKNKELIIFQNIDKIPGGIADLLPGALRSGATVCLIPGPDAERSGWNTLLANFELPSLGVTDSVDQDLSLFNDEDPLYKGVFESQPKNYKFPSLFKRYRLQEKNTQNFVSLFETGTGEPFLLYSKRFNGRVILMTCPLLLAFTDFQNHALFAATFLRFAETASLQKPLSLTIGQEENYPMDREISEKNPIHLVSKDYGTDVIPELVNNANERQISFAHLEDAIRNAGFYELTDRGDFSTPVAFNYDRKESQVACLGSEEIATRFGHAGWTSQPLLVTSQGTLEIKLLTATEYWRILLIFALIFIGVEIVLLRLWKT